MVNIFLGKSVSFLKVSRTFLKDSASALFFKKENLDEHRLKNIFLDFSDFICYNKTIKRKEVKLK